MVRTATATFLLIFAATAAFGHGDVAPQPVNTKALPDLSSDWEFENPYRGDSDVFPVAVSIGASGYNQNCARCHGLEAVSGGLAPDLRYLEADEFGDEWYVERFQNGYTQNGVTKMPAFGELLGQKAAWAIRSYIETRPDDGALAPFNSRLLEIRDVLRAADHGEGEVDIDALAAELTEISDQVPTASGAPIADSAASRALTALSASTPNLKTAHESLTVGLSAAR